MITFDGRAMYAAIKAEFGGVPAFARAMSKRRPRPLAIRTIWAWVRADIYCEGFDAACPNAHDLARAAELCKVPVGAFFHRVTSRS
jgi:hypothetical protein